MLILQELRNKVRYNDTRLKWKEEIDFSFMSKPAKAFSAGQAQAWISETYFLKKLIKQIEEEDKHH